MRVVYASLLATLLQPGMATASTYIVKPGDTLSRIARREIGNPVWGPNGSLQKLIRLNPSIKNPNVIAVKSSLITSDVEEADVVEVKDEKGPVAGAESAEFPGRAVTTPIASSHDGASAETLDDGEPGPESSQPAKDQLVLTISDGAEPSSESPFGYSARGVVSTTDVEVDAKDGTFFASPQSKINQGIELSLRYRVRPGHNLDLRIGLLKSEYANAKDGHLVGRDKLLKQITATYLFAFNSRTELSLGLGTQQVFFLGRTGFQDFEMEPIFVDTLEFGGSYVFYQNQAWTLAAKAALALEGKSSGRYVNPQAGHRKVIGISASYELTSTLDLVGSLSGEQRKQNTSIASQKNTDSVVKVGVSYRN